MVGWGGTSSGSKETNLGRPSAKLNVPEGNLWEANVRRSTDGVGVN